MRISAKGSTHVAVLSSNKAVADGAVSFYLDHFVSARVAHLTYGVQMGIAFDCDDPEHLHRSHQTYYDAAGIRRVSNAFSCILEKVCLSLLLILKMQICFPGHPSQRRNRVPRGILTDQYKCVSIAVDFDRYHELSWSFALSEMVGCGTLYVIFEP